MSNNTVNKYKILLNLHHSGTNFKNMMWHFCQLGTTMNTKTRRYKWIDLLVLCVQFSVAKLVQTQCATIAERIEQIKIWCQLPFKVGVTALCQDQIPFSN